MMSRMLLASLAAVFLTACITAPLMQESYFNNVATGVNISDIEATYGEPYEVRQLPNGMQEYSYIQRIDLGSTAVEQLTFIFVVKDGKVVNKQCNRNGTSSFQFVQ